MKRRASLLLIALLVSNMLLFVLGNESYAAQIESGKSLTAVAYNGNSDNPVYIAVGASGVMYRSEGADLSANQWAPIQANSILNGTGQPLSTFTANLNGVVYDPDEGIFVAGGQNSTILVSGDNGLTWRDKSTALRTASGSRAVWGLSYRKLSNGTKVFIAVLPTKSPANNEQAFVGQWNGSGFVWNGLSLSPNNSHSLGWNGDQLLIGSASQGARGMLHYFDFTGYTGGTPPISPTGTSLTNFNVYPGDTLTGDVRPIYGIAWFKTKWIAVSGNGGSGRAGIYISKTGDGKPSGTNGVWSENDFDVRQSTDYPAQFYSVASSETAVVAVGSAGAVFYSTDGVNFTKKTSGVSADLKSVIYDGSRFVVVGANGQVIWSTDGEDWSSSQSPGSVAEPYAYTGKMDGNQMVVDETFENLDFTVLSETYRYIPPRNPSGLSNTPPITITPSAVTLYDQGDEANLQATTVKLALNNDVYLQPAVSQAGSTFVNQIETVTRNNGAASKALRIKSSDGYGNAVLGFGFQEPQQGTIDLELDVFYPNVQANDARLPRLYAESSVSIGTKDQLSALISRADMPYFQLNNDGTGTITGGLTTGESLTDGKWRRVRFIVDTETGKVRTIIYNLDGRYAQDFETYELNQPGNISYDFKDGLLHVGFAANQFGHEGILIDNLKIYRELYYKDPVKPGTISVFQIDGKYYQYAVDGANQLIKVRSSEDMIVWRDEPDVQLNGSWASWNNVWHDFWAVEVYKFNGKYYLVYCAKKDTTLLNENFENYDFTAFPEISNSDNGWTTITKTSQKLALTDNGAEDHLDVATVELELNPSVRLKPVLGTANRTLNAEVITAPKGSDSTNKALHIYNDSDVAANSALSFLFNTNYRRGETVFEADVQYPGGINRRMYAESSVPLLTQDQLTTVIHDPGRPYLDFGGSGNAVMSGGATLGNFNSDTTWYHLVLRANYETGVVTATVRDESGNNVLGTGQYTFSLTDAIKNGVFHLGFADSQLGTAGMILDNIKVWNTDNKSFHRIGIAESDSISGPFTDSGRPLFDSYAAIDPHIFQDTDGKYYLYYSKDVSGNYVMVNGVEERQSNIYGVEMSSDLRSIIGEPVLLSAPTEPYERKSTDVGVYWNEAPWVHKYNNKYYLFYSTNNYNSMYYNLAYSTSDSPLGPFTKYSNNPIAQSDGLFPSSLMRGLGHNSIVASPDGSELFITYCPNQGDGSSGSLSVPEENKGSFFNRMGFREDGTVYVNGPTLQPQPLPSGIYGYTNIARSANFTASSTKSGYSLENLKNGEIGIYPKFADFYEWMSDNEKIGAWTQLAWPQDKTITSVAVYDSASPDRKISTGKLTFSNGTSIQVTFPNEHGAAAIATFPPMHASWVKFEVTGMLGSGDAGLSEIMVLGQNDRDVEKPVWPHAELTPSGITQTGLTLAWPAAMDDTGTVNYAVYMDGTLYKTVEGDVYQTDIDGLLAGKTYMFKVEAGDAAGNWTTDGPSVSVTTQDVSQVSLLKLALSANHGSAGDTIGVTGTTAAHTDVFIRIVDANGTPIAVTAAPTSDANGSFTGSFVIPSDMTSGLLYGTAMAGTRQAVANVLVVPPGTSYREPEPIESNEISVSEANKNLAITSATFALSEPVTVVVPGSVTDASISVTQLIYAPSGGIAITAGLPTLNTSTATSISSSPIWMAIPQGTTISAPASGLWDGTVHLPQVETAQTINLVPDPGKTAAVHAVIEVGFGDVPLTLSRAARIVIPGAAGKEAAYVRDGNLTKITNTISADNQAAADAEIAAAGDAALDVGVDKVIWTKHFTRFVLYTQTAIVPDSTNNDGSDNIGTGGANGSASTGNETDGNETETPLTPRVQFSDIALHWANANIAKLIALGAVEGYPDGTFRPDSRITRAEFTKFLVTALKLSPKIGNNYADTGSHWAKDYIATASAYGIIEGFSGNRFGPDDLISREQMAVMVVKAAKLPMSEEAIPFADKAEISAWAAAAVSAASKQGLIDGYPDHRFDPAGHATRAEAVTVITKLLLLHIPL
ncbi:family 43 glycosylhydrolase [Paenibacillus oryzisoli]|uniref:family 43 glycosylhydrolase n=1 Tax=Paenibacillus oryzisoli TaxID=1850517 RepID=UPI003D29C9DF